MDLHQQSTIWKASARALAALGAIACAIPSMSYAVGGTFHLYNQLLLSIVSRDSGFDKTAARPFN